jgi:small subunit ribosomal protein S8
MHLLSNLISSLKVANNAKLLKIEVNSSKFCVSVINNLYRLGYIRGFTVKEKNKIVVLLKYINNLPTIKNIFVISTPGRKVYLKSKELSNNLNRKDGGFYLISTSKGIMTDEEAVLLNLGGEVILKIC